MGGFATYRIARWLDPSWLGGLDPQELAELRRRAMLGLAQRQVSVSWSYALFFAVFAALTRFGRENTVLSISVAFLLFSLSAYRIWIARTIIARECIDCEAEARTLLLFNHIASLLWSGIVYYGVSRYGSEWTGFILVVGMAGIASGAAITYSSNLRHSIAILLILASPVMLWAFGPGQGGAMIFALTLVFVVYLVSLSRSLNHSFLGGAYQNLRHETQAVELVRAKEMAETATVAKTQFLAAMSHEIRTPLSGVLGLLNLLGETNLDDKQRELTQSIQQSGEHLLTILNDVLDYSKIGAGKLKLENVAFDLRGTVSEIVLPLRRIAETKRLTLEWHVSSDIAPWAQGDPTRVKQILNNLLSNALKFTGKGRVQLVVHKEADLVRFAVRDTGIGIAPESQAVLFEEFSQADQSTSRKFGGTGLGLAICSKLVAAMGGRIGVESAPGEGSLFWFAIPLPEAAPTVRRAPTTRRRVDQPLRVLIAEDNAVNQRVIVHMVRRMGHEIALAVNGREAVDLFERRDFDLILMDCQMPEMDGFEATRLIRASGERGTLPIVAVTANAFAEDREKCLVAGMTDHLAKPVQPRALERLLARVAGMLKECSLADEPFVDSGELQPWPQSPNPAPPPQPRQVPPSAAPESAFEDSHPERLARPGVTS